MSAETFNEITVVISLVPWLAIIVAMVFSLALDVRDSRRADHVHDGTRGEGAPQLRGPAHGRKAA